MTKLIVNLTGMFSIFSSNFIFCYNNKKHISLIMLLKKIQKCVYGHISPQTAAIKSFSLEALYSGILTTTSTSSKSNSHDFKFTVIIVIAINQRLGFFFYILFLTYNVKHYEII